VPVKVVRGVDEVTLWMWPDRPDPTTVRFDVQEWAVIERKAERVADGDVGRVIGQLLDEDLGDHLGA
jgi:hypothetical protein